MEFITNIASNGNGGITVTGTAPGFSGTVPVVTPALNHETVFNAGSWVANGANMEISIPLATHNQAAPLIVQTWQSIGGGQFQLSPAQSVIDDGAGNITLSVPAGSEFDGKVVIAGNKSIL